DDLANRVSSPTKHPIVSDRVLRQVHTARLEQFELQQLALDIFGGEFIANALQHLAENHISQPKTLSIEFGMHPVCLRILGALEVIDPDSRVDDHHAGYFATRPSRDVRSVPSVSRAESTIPHHRAAR